MPSGYPIPDPNPKFFPIPNPYPKSFQNLRVFRVSGISENKALSPNSSVIHFWRLEHRPESSLYPINWTVKVKITKQLKHQLHIGSNIQRYPHSHNHNTDKTFEFKPLPVSIPKTKLWDQMCGINLWLHEIPCLFFLSNQYKLFEVFCQNHTCVFFPKYLRCIRMY